MQNLIALLCIFFCLNNPGFSQLQFSAPEQVCDAQLYGGLRPKLVLLHDSIPIVSFGRAGTDPAFFVSRKTQGAFGVPNRINSPGSSPIVSTANSCEIKSSGDTVMLVYSSFDQQSSIVLWRSLDGGISYPDSALVASAAGELVDFPDLLLLQGGNPLVAYIHSDLAMTNTELRASYANSGGLVFTPSAGISGLVAGQPCECCPISLEKAGNTVFLGFRNNISNEREHYVLRSTDGGTNFSSAHQIDNSGWIINSCPTNGIDLVCGSDSVYAAYATKTGTTVNIFVNSLATDGSGTGMVLPNEALPPNQNMSHAAITGSGDTLFVLWQDTRNGNTDVFLSYRTSDGGSFSPAVVVNHLTGGTQRNIDAVYANGVLHMVYNDLSNNAVYYRKASLIQPLQTEELTRDINFQLYPNPAKDQLHILSMKKERIYTVSIYDMNGKKAKEIGGNYCEKMSINLNDLSAGMYFLSIESSSGFYHMPLLHE